MKKILCLLLLLPLAVGVSADNGKEDARTRNRYALAERFTAGKLQNMLFSTTVDPHWFKWGDNLWFSYKTCVGPRW